MGCLQFLSFHLLWNPLWSGICLTATWTALHRVKATVDIPMLSTGSSHQSQVLVLFLLVLAASDTVGHSLFLAAPSSFLDLKGCRTQLRSFLSTPALWHDPGSCLSDSPSLCVQPQPLPGLLTHTASGLLTAPLTPTTPLSPSPPPP